jgi:hypothetical protein
MLLAPILAQSKIAFAYILSYIQYSRILSPHIVDLRDDEIRLKNNVVVACYACTNSGVRGHTAVAIICDEIAYWADENSANPAEQVLAALRPAMVTVHNAKLIKISSPGTKDGVLWKEFSRRNELDFSVWQLITFEMNPSVPPEYVDAVRKFSLEHYRREFLAEFTDAINGWIDFERLDLCIVRGCAMLPPRSDLNYVAAFDAAFRGDDFALIVAHKTPDESVVVDFVKTWTGTKRVPLSFQAVLSEVKEILGLYQINSVTGDQYQSEPIEQYLLKLEIKFNRYSFSALTRGKLFSGLKYLVMQRKIELLDDVELLRQLRNLQEENCERGHFDVRPSNGKDDRAVTLALAVHVALAQERALPFEIASSGIRPSRTWLRLIPGQCVCEAVCVNCPDCMDAGFCLDFAPDPRLIQLST